MPECVNLNDSMIVLREDETIIVLDFPRKTFFAVKIDPESMLAKLLKLYGGKIFGMGALNTSIIVETLKTIGDSVARAVEGVRADVERLKREVAEMEGLARQNPDEPEKEAARLEREQLPQLYGPERHKMVKRIYELRMKAMAIRRARSELDEKKRALEEAERRLKMLERLMKSIEESVELAKRL
jgi:DNA repair exonuclease SbcCD ATPase subunit